MVTEDLTRKVKTAGNGVTTAFGFTFPVEASDELVVQLEVIATGVLGAALTEGGGSEYTVVVNTASEGGTVTMNTPPPSTDNILITRVLPLDMDTNIPTVGNVQESQLEGEFDKQARVNIQIQEELDRTPKQSIAEVGAKYTIPTPVAGKGLGWNTAGDDFANLDVSAEDAAVSAAAALVSENAAATDAVSTAADVVSTNADVVLAAASAASIIPDWTNKSGGAFVLGDVVINDTGTADGVTSSTTLSDTRVIGVAQGAIDDDAVGSFLQTGETVVDIKGTVTIGDYIRQSTTAKHAESAGTTFATGVFGVAMATGTDTTVSCILFPVSNGITQDFIKHSGESQLTVIRGQVTITGSIVVGTGFTNNLDAIGVHIVTYGSAYSAIPASMAVAIDASTTVFTKLNVNTVSAATIHTLNSSGSLTSAGVGFIMMGPT